MVIFIYFSFFNKSIELIAASPLRRKLYPSQPITHPYFAITYPYFAITLPYSEITKSYWGREGKRPEYDLDMRSYTF